METYKDRLERFKKGSPLESLGTLLGSITTFFINKELRVASDKKLWALLILGMHVTIETIADVFYGNSKDIKNIRKYHEVFVDDSCLGCDFSKIVREINEWRNALAHKWIYKKGHYINIDPSQKEGWKREGGALYINPRIYFKCFVKAFGVDGKMGDIDDIFSEKELSDAKERMIKKFMGK